MTWFRVDDGMPSHGKWLDLGERYPDRHPDCIALWLIAGCHASDKLTDGRVKLAHIRRVWFAAPEQMTAAADALVEFGLWDTTDEPGVYQIHDYGDYNPKRSDVLAKREADAERKRKGGKARAGLRAESVRNPSGVQAESIATPRGIQMDSERTPQHPARPGPARPGPISIVSAYADTHPLKPSLEGEGAGEPGSPVAGLGVAEHVTEALEPAQGKPEAADAMPGGFALTPPPAGRAQAARARAEAFSRAMISHLNAATGRMGSARYDVIAESSVKLAAGLIAAGHTIDQARAVIDAKVLEWASDRPGNLKPSTLFRLSNFKRYLEEDVKAGLSQAVPTRGRFAAMATDDAFRGGKVEI